MAEEAKNIGDTTHYKQTLPSGLAAEIASEGAGRVGDAGAFGPWLKERLDAASASPAQLALLSGVTAGDLTQLLAGQSVFALDADHLQRFATALGEMGVVSDTSVVWTAAGFEDSDYILPPTQVVQSMSGTT
jgi:hypothetical protein